MHYIIFIAVATIMVLNCVFTVHVAYEVNEKVSYFVQPQYVIVALIMGMIASIVFGKLNKFSEKTMFVIFSILYVGIMIYMVLNIKVCIRADARSVLDAAEQIASKNYESLKKRGYIYISKLVGIGFV